MEGCGYYIEASTTGTVLRWIPSSAAVKASFSAKTGEHGLRELPVPESQVRAGHRLVRPGRTAQGRHDGLQLGDRQRRGLELLAPTCTASPHNFDHNTYKFQDWPNADLKGKTPILTRVEKNIDVHPEGSQPPWPGTDLKNDFSIVWTGLIKIEKEGAYKFYSRACNGSRVLIDGKLVVDNASFHGCETENDGTVQLSAGNHDFRVEFYCDRGMQGCVVSWEPPGGQGKKAAVPENVLLHEKAPGQPEPGLKAEYFDIAGANMPFDQAKPVIVQFGSKQYMDLQTLRSELGLEMHGKVVQQFDPTPLGLVTFRVHDTKNSWKPVPMFGNPDTERNDPPTASEDHPYFWKKGSFRGIEEYDWRSVDVGYNCSTRGDQSGLVRQLRVPGKFTEPPQWAKWGLNEKSAARPDHVACLQVASVRDKVVCADGFGFWGVSLPTTDGAQIDLSLWVRAKNLKSPNNDGGLYVTAEFADDTGQNTRASISSAPTMAANPPEPTG